jgi:hypothetical protein
MREPCWSEGSLALRRFAIELNGDSIGNAAAFRRAHKNVSLGSDYYRKLSALHPVTKKFYTTLG